MVSYVASKEEVGYEDFVLILIVVDDGLVWHLERQIKTYNNVLILIVVDDGLVLDLIRRFWFSIS